MVRIYSAIMALFLSLTLAACATVSTSVLEPQSKQRDPRLARLYFIWPRSMMLRTATIDIKIDGQVVGKIAPDSYFFVDRQPGTYTLKVEPPFDFAYFEAKVQVMAGGTYYYAMSVRSTEVPLAGGGFVTLSQPQHGAPMEPTSTGGRFASYKLNAVDPAAATAEMVRLDAQR
jgi:hypothetical protein